MLSAELPCWLACDRSARRDIHGPRPHTHLYDDPHRPVFAFSKQTLQCTRSAPHHHSRRNGTSPGSYNPPATTWSPETCAASVARPCHQQGRLRTIATVGSPPCRSQEAMPPARQVRGAPMHSPAAGLRTPAGAAAPRSPWTSYHPLCLQHGAPLPRAFPWLCQAN